MNPRFRFYKGGRRTHHRRRVAAGSGLVPVSLLKGGAVPFGTDDVSFPEFGSGLLTLGKFCLRIGRVVWFGEGAGKSPTYES